MSRASEVTLDWGDGTYAFALKWGQLIELQEKCDAGPAYILSQLIDGTWRVEQIANILRLGLIGGGMEPVAALKLVRTYVHDRPPLENLPPAQAVLAAAVMGAPDEEPGKPEAGATKRPSRSRAGKSGSRKSSAPAPSSA